MVPGIAQSPAVGRLFKALDQNNDNKLDFREVLFGVFVSISKRINVIIVDDLWIEYSCKRHFRREA